MTPDYRLIRSARKTLSLEVTASGDVVVRAPNRLPKREIDRFAESRAQWIGQAKERQRARAQAYPEPAPEELKALAAEAKAFFPERVRYYGALMGLTPSSVKITAARTRFGSCSAKNALCFSCRLMRFPQEARDYVVVHELAHIVHKNHGPHFYALIGSVLPDWQARREMLKR